MDIARRRAKRVRLCLFEMVTMILMAVIFACVTSYCAWIIRRDTIELNSILDRQMRERGKRIVQWHLRAAVASICGMVIALVAALI